MAEFAASITESRSPLRIGGYRIHHRERSVLGRDVVHQAHPPRIFVGPKQSVPWRTRSPSRSMSRSSFPTHHHHDQFGGPSGHELIEMSGPIERVGPRKAGCDLRLHTNFDQTAIRTCGLDQ